MLRLSLRELLHTKDGQCQAAENTIADVDASGLWTGKAVTKISGAGRFWEAEAEDQDPLQRHPDGYTCHFPRPSWKLPHRETVEEALATRSGSPAPAAFSPHR